MGACVRVCVCNIPCMEDTTSDRIDRPTDASVNRLRCIGCNAGFTGTYCEQATSASS
jgi:hypothetical protein